MKVMDTRVGALLDLLERSVVPRCFFVHSIHLILYFASRLIGGYSSS